MYKRAAELGHSRAPGQVVELPGSSLARTITMVLNTVSGIFEIKPSFGRATM